MSGQCIPLSAMVCVFSLSTARLRHRTTAAMVTGLLTGSIFLNIVLSVFCSSKWTVTVMVLVRDSKWHIVIMLLCKEYFKYGYCLKENILIVNAEGALFSIFGDISLNKAYIYTHCAE